MNNNYISKYAKHDTHFARTDPFKYGYFDEDSNMPVFAKVLAGLGFACFIVALALLPEITKALLW